MESMAMPPGPRQARGYVVNSLERVGLHLTYPVSDTRWLPEILLLLTFALEEIFSHIISLTAGPKKDKKFSSACAETTDIVLDDYWEKLDCLRQSHGLHLC